MIPAVHALVSASALPTSEPCVTDDLLDAVVLVREPGVGFFFFLDHVERALCAANIMDTQAMGKKYETLVHRGGTAANTRCRTALKTHWLRISAWEGGEDTQAGTHQGD